jgi:hypothetical protein
MSTRDELSSDLSALQAEMRRILPPMGPKVSQTYRDIRALNQARFDASLRGRQRPTRVS